MKKVYTYNSKNYSFAVYVSKNIYYISNEHGTRKATKKEIKMILAEINKPN
jgi:hypothetical protein